MKSFKKIIHQIWFQGKNKIPERFLLNIKKNKSFTDWEYKIWDNESILKLLATMNPKYLDKYKKYKLLHQKVDYGRYCILYKYGGFYIDMDAYMIKDPSFLIEKYPKVEVFISKINLNYLESLLSSGNLQILNNGIILAHKNSNLMYNLINKCPQDSNYPIEIMKIQLTTGPQTFRKIVKQSKNIKILEYDFFEPCIKNICNKTLNTITLHKHEGSWVKPYFNKCIVFYLKYKYKIYWILFCIFLLNIIFIYYYIKYYKIEK